MSRSAIITGAVQDYNTRIRTFPEMIGAKRIHGAKPLTPVRGKGRRR